VTKFVIIAIGGITLGRLAGTYMEDQLEVEVVIVAVAEDKVEVVDQAVVEDTKRHMWLTA
jgi:hypothetical protein